MKQLLAWLGLLFGYSLLAQQNFPVNGMHDERPGVYAFTQATIHVDHQEVIENGVMVIEKGEIKRVGDSLTNIPSNAIVHPLNGRHIYPSFIELYGDFGMPEPQDEKKEQSKEPQFLSDKDGPFGWNEAIQPEVEAASLFNPGEKKAGQWRKAGFGSILTHRQDGIVRGSAALVDLSGRNANESIIAPKVAGGYAFDKGTSSQDYPSSLMGSIALLRQTFHNADWYAASQNLPQIAYNASLEHMSDLMELPGIFAVNNKLSVLRAAKIGREFGLPFIIKGNGDEYQELDAIRDADMPLILPLNFPKAFDVSSPYAMEYVSWADLKHWEVAPFNPRILASHGVEFAFTMDGNDSAKDFWKHLRKAVQVGLPDSVALKALTFTPAQLLDVDQQLGSLAPGKWASFFITDRPVFEKDATILENWSRGQRFVMEEMPPGHLAGNYQLYFKQDTLLLSLEVGKNKLKVKALQPDSVFTQPKLSKDGPVMHLLFTQKGDSLSPKDKHYMLTGMLGPDGASGRYQDSTGTYHHWQMRKTGPLSKDTTVTDSVEIPPIPYYQRYPFHAYGYDSLPSQQKFLITNATVWTNEQKGILDNIDVLVESGVIAAMGSNLDTSGAIIIDAQGKHLTSGIIDEHSHMAISRGVNEGTQASSAEVRIGDVINNEDVNIYRQLAGGVTASQLLHGSANPIGGQSALIKLRWGWNPEQLKFSNAAPFIKFALGENVKQSNWGDHQTERYPQTRMGVEQIYYDYFHEAAEYLDEWDRFEILSEEEQQGSLRPRQDLEMDALGEILNGERFITCHSYVQSEVNMLMHVADSLDFTINTFTHILEGYKVADKMKAHGAGGSTFSDWWAYKYEVIDAIPHNAALMTKVGVISAINSDNREMGSRLNQEAAKTMKYGGLSREEAWKLVTLNPAKLMQVDHRVGSIKVGKDADLVIWSDDPLSVYAQVERTFVDGRLMYDAEAKAQKMKWIQKDRQRLITKMREKEGKDGRKPAIENEKHYHCDDVEDVFKTEKP